MMSRRGDVDLTRRIDLALEREPTCITVVNYGHMHSLMNEIVRRLGYVEDICDIKATSTSERTLVKRVDKEAVPAGAEAVSSESLATQSTTALPSPKRSVNWSQSQPGSPQGLPTAASELVAVDPTVESETHMDAAKSLSDALDVLSSKSSTTPLKDMCNFIQINKRMDAIEEGQQKTVSLVDELLGKFNQGISARKDAQSQMDAALKGSLDSLKKESNKKLATLKAHMTDLQADINGLKEEKTGSSKSLSDVKSPMSGSQAHVGTPKAVDSLKKDMDVLKAHMTDLQADVNGLKEEKNGSSKSLSDVKSPMSGSQAHVGAPKAVDSLKKDMDVLKAHMTDLQADVNGLKEEKNGSSKSLSGVKPQMSSSQAHVGAPKAVDSLKKDMDVLKAHMTDLQADVNGLKEEKNGSSKSLSGVKPQMSGLQAHVGTPKAVDSLKKDMDVLKAHMTDLQADVNGLKEEKNGSSKRLSGVKPQMSSSQAHVGAPKAVDSLKKDMDVLKAHMTDLQADVNGLKEEKNGSSKSLSGVKPQMSGLQAHVGTPKAVDSLKKDMDALKAHMTDLQADMNALKGSIQQLDLTNREDLEPELVEGMEGVDLVHMVFEMQDKLAFIEGQLNSTSDDSTVRIQHSSQVADQISLVSAVAGQLSSESLVSADPSQAEPSSTQPILQVDLNDFMDLQEIVGDMKTHLDILQDQQEELMGNANHLVSEFLVRKEHIKTLYTKVQDLEEGKADKETIEVAVQLKADRAALDHKASRQWVQSTFERQDKEFREARSTLEAQNEALRGSVDRITEDVDHKLDRNEIDNLRNYMDKKLKAVRQPIILKKLDGKEPAGFKRRISGSCISCDRAAVMTLGQSPPLCIPKGQAMPLPQKTFVTGAPYMCHHLTRSLRSESVVPRFSTTNYRSAGGDCTLTNAHRRLRMTPLKARYSRLDAQQLAQASAAHNQGSMLGRDGRVYKGVGRLGLRMGLPVIHNKSEVTGLGYGNRPKTNNDARGK